MDTDNPAPHLNGFLRRILKLLFFGVKPVFIFDGRTPELKRQTLIKRKLLRQKQQVDFKKAAERLLHNVMKEKVLAALDPAKSDQ